MNRQLIAGLSNDLTPSQELLTVFQFDLRIVTVISKKAWNPSSLDKAMGLMFRNRGHFYRFRPDDSFF